MVGPDAEGVKVGRKGERTLDAEATRRLGCRGFLAELVLQKILGTGTVFLGMSRTDSPFGIEMQNLFCHVSRKCGPVLRQPSCLRNTKKLGLKNTSCTAILWRKHRMAGILISLCSFLFLLIYFNDFIFKFLFYS